MFSVRLTHSLAHSSNRKKTKIYINNIIYVCIILLHRKNRINCVHQILLRSSFNFGKSFYLLINWNKSKKKLYTHTKQNKWNQIKWTHKTKNVCFIFLFLFYDHFNGVYCIAQCDWLWFNVNKISIKKEYGTRIYWKMIVYRNVIQIVLN